MRARDVSEAGREAVSEWQTKGRSSATDDVQFAVCLRHHWEGEEGAGVLGEQRLGARGIDVI